MNTIPELISKYEQNIALYKRLQEEALYATSAFKYKIKIEVIQRVINDLKSIPH